MGKLVMLKIGEGSFEQGFPVTVQIGAEGDRPSTEITGKLPPNPDLPQIYGCWQSTYWNLGLRSRLHPAAVQVTNVSVINDCHHAAEVLQQSLNRWLQSEPFRPIREKLLEKLMPSDSVRLILQVEDPQLQRLPWHLWDWFDRYSKAEMSVSAPVYERVDRPTDLTDVVRILAVLGSSQGIDIQTDRVLLEQLPDAEVSFLVEPQLKDLTDRLWGQAWDILFFAGHSSSQDNGSTGRIYLNQHDSLTIAQLKFALRKAVERGLKLAIFNSCDGLGLARELADLQIPQLIVMREPVPDRVAQEFLKYFLAAFAQDQPFYLAVRQARERLQGLEDRFPCATWLPVICQNPAETPPTWRELRRTDTAEVVSLPVAPPTRLDRRRLLTVLLVSTAIAALVVGTRYLGLFQSLELKAFDQMMRSRPKEGSDPRLLVVAINDADIEAQRQNHEPLRGISLSDRSLARLLTILEQYQPRAIGIDLYRDFAVEPAQAKLATQLKHPNLIGICKGSDAESNTYGVAPPPEIPPNQLSFSDFVREPDDVLRRHLLFLTPSPDSACRAPYAFSVQLAFQYLAKAGVTPSFTTDQNLQLGQTIFRRIQPHTSGYQRIDARGSQVLLNYRASENIAAQVSLTSVLKGQLDPSAVKDRIVLIGVTAHSSDDYWVTPYTAASGKKTPGVLVQADMVSQILSAVLDQRPLLWVWTLKPEIAWILVWSLLGGLLSWLLRSPLQLGLTIATAILVLYGICFGILLQGGWVPFIPSGLGLVVSSLVGSIYPPTRKPPSTSLHQE